MKKNVLTFILFGVAAYVIYKIVAGSKAAAASNSQLPFEPNYSGVIEVKKIPSGTATTRPVSDGSPLTSEEIGGPAWIPQEVEE